MSVRWTFSGSPGTVLKWTADSDKCHTACLIRFTRHRGFESVLCAFVGQSICLVCLSVYVGKSQKQMALWS